MKKWVALLVLCTHLTAFAEDAKFLKRGEAAPFDGFLITQEKADKIHDMSVDLEATKRILELTKQDNTYYVDRLENYKTHTESLSKQLAETRDDSIWKKAGFFFLGAAAATVVAYGAVRAVR